jgi:archaellum component FlaC
LPSVSFSCKSEQRVAQSGNGVDLASVYQLLSEVAEAVRSHSNSFTRMNDRLDRVENQLGDLDASVADLRAAVRDYHT